MGTKAGDGFAAVEGGVVGWINGGEPVDGCDLVSLLIFASSREAVQARAREIGLWSSYVMDGFGGIDPNGVAAAVADPDGFVWNEARGGGWRPSAELVRRKR